MHECIDRRLAKEIEGHEVVTVPQAGWAGIQNGELLRRAQEQFDVFVTVDRNLSFQQYLPQFNIAVIVSRRLPIACKTFVRCCLNSIERCSWLQKGK